jgi:hypothetical protein
MRRIVFLMLAVFIVSISMYGDIGKGDWTQDEINYFKKKEYIGNYKYYFYDYSIQYPPYSMEMMEGEYIGYGPSDTEILAKLILIGKIAEEDEFRYLSLIRNEMYARNGYIFQDEDLKAFFNQMPWYKPISEDIQLNGYERTNLRRIKKIEKEIKDILQNKQKEFEFANRYEKKIIIKAKWGEEKGEFKLGPLAENWQYMTCLTVCPNGKIYIVDPNNRRINVFNQNGKYEKEINIPNKFFTRIGKDTMASIAGIGVDNNNNIWIGIASSEKFKVREKGKVIVKMDQNGNIVDKFIFRGEFAYPLYFYIPINDREIYIRTGWHINPTHIINTIIPIELLRNRSVGLDKDYLESISIEKTKILPIKGKRIKLADEFIYASFNIYKDSILVYFNGQEFVFQDFNGKVKNRFKTYWADYPRGKGFHHGIYTEVTVFVYPIIDKDLNIYCITGDSEYLKVIKYEFKK